MQPRVSSVVAAVAAMSLIACAPKDEEANAKASAAIDAAVATNTVTIHGGDFAFDVSSEANAGMVKFKFFNDGPSIHHATVVRLDSGKTVADLQAALKNPGPPPAWMVPMGGPNAPDPKSESNATLNLAAGNYAVICFVDMPGGVPHFSKGMVHALTVNPSPKPAGSAPSADISVTLNDYMFVESKPLSSGTHTFAVSNNAAQMHELEILKLAPGKTPKDVGDWMAKPVGPPPANLVGGMAPMAPGGPAYFTADLTPGNYLVICFVPDMKDGKPHFEHGMMQPLTIN
jgi:hypothetical protein